MSYVIYHHGTYRLQIRVPNQLVLHYCCRVLRINLQTSDCAVAQHQAYQFADQWLAAFTATVSG